MWNTRFSGNFEGPNDPPPHSEMYFTANEVFSRNFPANVKNVMERWKTAHSAGTINKCAVYSTFDCLTRGGGGGIKLYTYGLPTPNAISLIEKIENNFYGHKTLLRTVSKLDFFSVFLGGGGFMPELIPLPFVRHCSRTGPNYVNKGT